MGKVQGHYLRSKWRTRLGEETRRGLDEKDNKNLQKAHSGTIMSNVMAVPGVMGSCDMCFRRLLIQRADPKGKMDQSICHLCKPFGTTLVQRGHVLISFSTIVSTLWLLNLTLGASFLSHFDGKTFILSVSFAVLVYGCEQPTQHWRVTSESWKVRWGDSHDHERESGGLKRLQAVWPFEVVIQLCHL